MERVYNFSAGPGMLPIEVLEKAQKELLNYNDAGMSVLEMSHRSKTFMGIIENAENLLREIMKIPDNYKVLFLQGGAYTQFAMIPINLLRKYDIADYVNTGAWSTKAIAEAEKYGKIIVVGSSEDKKFTYIPELNSGDFSKDADYVHITMNNTIFGTKYNKTPDTGDIPLVADMSTFILSEEFDISKFGLIYAGAQKNIGPAGVTIVIIRDDLIGYAKEFTPTMLDYETHANKKSLFNTPPCFSVYIAELVFNWIKENGGVKAIEEINKKKADLLYSFIDNSKLFTSNVKKENRSIMNIPFLLPDDNLNKKFILEAGNNGLVTLAGHRSVGGMRASIYNAMPLEGVIKLVDFMKKFEEENK